MTNWKPRNVGEGDYRQRTVNLIHRVVTETNPVTRYVCMEILANDLVRAMTPRPEGKDV